MTSIQMAQLATYALYAAMASLGCALVAFTVYTAHLASGRHARRAEVVARTENDTRTLVGSGSTRRGSGAAVGEAVGSSPRGSTSPVAGATSGGAMTAAGPVGAATETTREPASGSLGMSLSWLGALLLLASMALRGLAVSRVPVANLFEFAVAGATATLLTYLVLAQRRPLRWLGIFVVTPVLSVIGLALVAWYVPAAELAPALQSYWIAIHVPIAILSIGIFTVAFCVLVVQLGVERREQRRAAGEALAASRLGTLLDSVPSAERLDRIAYSLHVAAFPLWTFTIIAGAIWGQKAWGTYWSWDPKEVWSFVIWVLYAAYLHARATSGWRRRTANLIAVAGYVAILLNTTVVNFFFSGLHCYSGL